MVETDTRRRTGNLAEVVIVATLADGRTDRFGAVMVRTDAGWRLALTVAGPP